MVLSTDAGALFVHMNGEHFDELHLQVLKVEIDQAVKLGYLDRWHIELDDMIDVLVKEDAS